MPRHNTHHNLQGSQTLAGLRRIRDSLTDIVIYKVLKRIGKRGKAGRGLTDIVIYKVLKHIIGAEGESYRLTDIVIYQGSQTS